MGNMGGLVFEIGNRGGEEVGWGCGGKVGVVDSVFD